MRNKVDILGIRYTNITYSELLSEIDQNISKKKKSTISQVPVDCVMLSRKNPYLKHLYNSFNYVIADGKPIQFASKLLRTPLPERIAGVELLQGLIKQSCKKKYSIFILGSNEERIKLFSRKVCKKNMGKIYHYCPPLREEFDEKDNQIMIKKINKANPDILFVVLGAPKQDKWIQKNIKKANARIFISIGAAFDYYTGSIKRAPKWMCDLGFEWLYRLAQDPLRLWKRYARDFLFPFIVLGAKMRNK
jgi:N-acetylglucosaminyldiphosphoundecaprenol N-acetyl-beta-D-mannosaminyltransferase